MRAVRMSKQTNGSGEKIKKLLYGGEPFSGGEWWSLYRPKSNAYKRTRDTRGLRFSWSCFEGENLGPGSALEIKYLLPPTTTRKTKRIFCGVGGGGGGGGGGGRVGEGGGEGVGGGGGV